MNALNIAVRVIHILSAIALVGGTAYIVLALLPTLRLVEPEFKQTLLKLARRRYYRIAHPAITLLLITGAWTWYSNLAVYHTYMTEHGPLLEALLGTKVLFAIIIAVVLFGESMNLIKAEASKRAAFVVALGVTIVVLAGIIRSLRLSVLHT